MSLVSFYFDPSGRINRSSFWLKGVLLLHLIWGALLISILVVLLNIEVGGGYLRYPLLFEILTNPRDFILFVLLGVILFAGYWWNSFAVTAKRLHDRDKSAGWILLWWAISVIGGPLTFGLATVVVAIWMIVELGFLEGTPGRNRYGYSETDLELRERQRAYTRQYQQNPQHSDSRPDKCQGFARTATARFRRLR